MRNNKILYIRLVDLKLIDKEFLFYILIKLDKINRFNLISPLNIKNVRSLLDEIDYLEINIVENTLYFFNAYDPPYINNIFTILDVSDELRDLNELFLWSKNNQKAINIFLETFKVED